MQHEIFSNYFPAITSKLSPFSQSITLVIWIDCTSVDDKLWVESSDEESDKVEEIMPSHLSWDSGEDVPEEDWDRLFEDSGSNDDMDGF